MIADILTQKLRFRQSVVLYSLRNSVLSTIRKFGISRATVYRWRKMYDGTISSLAERSRRPHSHPNQHTAEELKLISDMRHYQIDKHKIDMAIDIANKLNRMPTRH